MAHLSLAAISLYIQVRCQSEQAIIIPHRRMHKNISQRCRRSARAFLPIIIYLKLNTMRLPLLVILITALTLSLCSSADTRTTRKKLKRITEVTDTLSHIDNDSCAVCDSLLFSNYIIRKTKCSGFPKRNVPLPKTKRTFFSPLISDRHNPFQGCGGSVFMRLLWHYNAVLPYSSQRSTVAMASVRKALKASHSAS